MPRVKLTIKAELMRWARRSAAVPRRTATETLGITEGQLASWESEGAEVSPRELEVIADLYKRSTAVFFLPEAPPDPALPVDFRASLGITGSLDAEILFALRHARRMQRIFSELETNLERTERGGLPTLKPDEDPAAAAERIRSGLDVSVDDQLAWSTARIGLRVWRHAVEDMGFLTFQEPMPMSPTKKARGFSLPGTPPVIVLNSRDQASARTFTLFHELAHLCIGEPGICAWDATARVSQTWQTERFCNDFAGHLLVPTATLRIQPEVSALRSKQVEVATALSLLAKTFSVSRDVVLWRLYAEKLVTKADFDHARSFLAAVSGRGGTGPITSWAEKRIGHLGRRFVATVLEAQQHGVATSADVCDFLGIKIKHFDAMHDVIRAA